MRWCRTGVLEYEHQMEKIFGGRSALGQKAASMSTLRNNTTTSNDVFDPRLANSTTEQDVENETQEDSSYLDRIDKEFGPLSEGEESVEETENRPRAKKAKIHHNAGPSSKDPHQSTDDTPSQSKSTKKKNVGLELANQMKEWREYREKEFEQRELAKLSPEAQIMRNIQEHYAKEVEKLSYEEYSQLVLLLRKRHDEAIMSRSFPTCKYICEFQIKITYCQYILRNIPFSISIRWRFTSWNPSCNMCTI